MAGITEAKFRSTKKSLTPNSKAFREFCRKNSLDMVTGEKINLKTAYTLQNDLEAGKVIMKKDATRKEAIEKGLSFYAKETAEKRAKAKQAWMDNRDATPKPKKAAKKSATKKAPAKAKKAPAKKAPRKAPRKVAAE